LAIIGAVLDHGLLALHVCYDSSGIQPATNVNYTGREGGVFNCPDQSRDGDREGTDEESVLRK